MAVPRFFAFLSTLDCREGSLYLVSLVPGCPFVAENPEDVRVGLEPATRFSPEGLTDFAMLRFCRMLSRFAPWLPEEPSRFLSGRSQTLITGSDNTGAFTVGVELLRWAITRPEFTPSVEKLSVLCEHVEKTRRIQAQ
jgi:hypothetical protein